MKLLTAGVLSALIAPLAAQAGDRSLTGEVLTLLISKANEVQLVNDDGQPSRQSLPELLGEALAVTSLATPGQTVTINSVSSDCEAKDMGGRVGAQEFTCSLSINNGDYVQTRNGYRGPTLESSYILTFDAVRVVVPGAKLQLKGKKVTLGLAG